MSEMLANQYFISGRYFEAFEEYSRLPSDKQDSIPIKEKMIISLTLDNNFKKVLLFFKRLTINDLRELHKSNIQNEESWFKKILNKIETQNIKSKENRTVRTLQIAILNFYYDRKISIKYFNKVKNSKYKVVVNEFLQLNNKFKTNF